MSEHPIRICALCGGVDDHPRHVIETDPSVPPVQNKAVLTALIARDDLTPEVRAEAAASLGNPSEELRHMDCCRAAGCPSGDCDNVPDLRGDELRAHITGGNQ